MRDEYSQCGHPDGNGDSASEQAVEPNGIGVNQSTGQDDVAQELFK